MHLFCRTCKRDGLLDPARWAGRPGPVWCFHCRRQIDVVDVSRWAAWVAGQVERKRQLQDAGRLFSRKQAAHKTDGEADSDGTAGELAACLLLCPGFLGEWQQAAERGISNRGRDLLPFWTCLPKPAEVKFTRIRRERWGYLLERPPAGGGFRMRPGYVSDSLYFLVQPCGPRLSLGGWVDRNRFLQRRVENPWGIQPGKTECWGVHWSRLEPPDRLPEPAHVNYAVLPPTTGAARDLDLWYGYSAADGWVVVDWDDPRNRPGRPPRQLYMLRCRDDVEVRVPYRSWSPPEYLDAASRLDSLVGAERERGVRELASIQLRLEGVGRGPLPQPTGPLRAGGRGS